MPPYRLLFGVVAPIVAVAVAVNDHVNVNGRTLQRKTHLNQKGNAGAFGASLEVRSGSGLFFGSVAAAGELEIQGVTGSMTSLTHHAHEAKARRHRPERT